MNEVEINKMKVPFALKIYTPDNIDDIIDAVRYQYNVLGIWNNEERNDNMNILELWKERKIEDIEKGFKEIVNSEYEKLDVVKEYNELVTNFDINLKQLADKYNTSNECLLVRTGYKNGRSIELSPNIKGDIELKYNKELCDNLGEVEKIFEEVKALLSLSDDKDYQLDVLKNYKILDKKGKLII